MKNPKQNALRWIREAEQTLRQAEQNSKEGTYNVACFLAEQAAQKSLKAVFYLDGARFITIHSIAELIKEVSKKRPEFLQLFNEGVRLDKHYLSSRYPDAVPEPAIPSEIYVQDEAEEAISIAKKIFEACRSSMQ